MEVAEHIIEYLLLGLLKHMTEAVGRYVILNLGLFQPILIHEQHRWVFQLPLGKRFPLEEIFLKELSVLFLALFSPLQRSFDLF